MRRSQVHGQVDYRYHSVTAGYVRRETLVRETLVCIRKTAARHSVYQELLRYFFCFPRNVGKKVNGTSGEERGHSPIRPVQCVNDGSRRRGGEPPPPVTHIALTSCAEAWRPWRGR